MLRRDADAMQVLGVEDVHRLAVSAQTAAGRSLPGNGSDASLKPPSSTVGGCVFQRLEAQRAEGAFAVSVQCAGWPEATANSICRSMSAR